MHRLQGHGWSQLLTPDPSPRVQAMTTQVSSPAHDGRVPLFRRWLQLPTVESHLLPGALGLHGPSVGLTPTQHKHPATTKRGELRRSAHKWSRS